MTHDFAQRRDRIHRKSQEYFTFEYGRRDQKKWRMFYGATDALLDAATAAAGYPASITSNTSSNLLACYGFLQSIYIQQDAVITLSRAVGINWHPRQDARLREIRELRNRLTGHPSNADRQEIDPRRSSAIIAYNNITKQSFSGYIYYEDDMESVTVNVPLIFNDNEDRLALQMKVIERAMDQEEQNFRVKHMAKPLSAAFEGPLDYLMQKINCDLSDSGQVAQAAAHIEMVRERMQSLQQDLSDRNFEWEGTKYHLRLVFRGLELLENLLQQANHGNQDDFELLHDGLEVNVEKLREFMKHTDKKLNTRVVEQSQPDGEA